MKITEIQETPDSKKRRWPRVNGREIPWTPEQIKWFEKFGLANGVFYDKKNEAEITNPNIIIKTFLLNLKEASAKPDTCLQFILQMRKEIKNIKIIYLRHNYIIINN
jgi:hypothetical protein